jgi:hypothetical protein
MLPYATPPISAQLDPYEDTERDTLSTQARRRLGPPAQVGARIALALSEVEAGMRSPLQLERLCHLTLWPKLAEQPRRPGGGGGDAAGRRQGPLGTHRTPVVRHQPPGAGGELRSPRQAPHAAGRYLVVHTSGTGDHRRSCGPAMVGA